MTSSLPTPPEAPRDAARSLEDLLKELEALRGRCVDYENRLAEQQQALVDLSMRRNEEFVLLYSLLEFSKTISSSLDKGALLDAVVELLERIFGLAAVAVFEWRREAAEFVLTGTSLPGLSNLDVLTLAAQDPLVRPVLHSGQVCLVDDLLTSGGEFCRRYLPEMGAALCAPMLSRGRLSGVIAAFGADAATFDDRHFHVMSAFAAHLAIALENSDLHSRLQLQAVTDELTGLLNRRALDDQLLGEAMRGIRQDEPLSMLMIDIDHFKQFNDTYGHHAGDVLLNRLGQLLVRTLRRSDICIRYGGEEFLVVLPGTNAELACVVASRIGQGAEDLCVGPMGLDGASEAHKVTVSIGVATTAGREEQSVTALLCHADQAMYRAKALGRNRVCVFKDEPTAVADQASGGEHGLVRGHQ